MLGIACWSSCACGSRTSLTTKYTSRAFRGLAASESESCPTFGLVLGTAATARCILQRWDHECLCRKTHFAPGKLGYWRAVSHTRGDFCTLGILRTRGGELLLLAIFHAARAAYIVVNWMLLGCAGGGVDTTELLKGGGSWVCRPVAGGRSGSNIHGVSLPGVTMLCCTGSCCLLDGSLESIVRGDFASRCRFAVGFVVVIARVCCFCLGLRSSYGKPSESVVRGEVGGSCPPVK